MSINFFEHLKPWSRRKHRLLGKYLPPFSAKVATATANRKIFCIDGFAGAARYDDGSEGSPILIAKFSDECSRWKNPVELTLINVEPDPRSEGIFESLEYASSSWVEKGTVINVNSEFRTALPEILQIIRNSPALFFLDPFGPTHVFFDDLRPILTRPQRITELIINFDQDGLRRIVDAALSKNTHPKTAATNEANVSKIIDSDEWKDKVVLAGRDTAMAESILLHEYMANLAKFGYEVVAYPIRENLGTKPKYYFVYCTRHKDGIALMNDFIREEEDSLYGDHVEVNLPLFSEEASLSNAKENRQSQLRPIILGYVHDRRQTTRGNIRKILLPLHFGEFHSKEYNAVVQMLLRDGKIKEATGKKRINDDDVLRIVEGK